MKVSSGSGSGTVDDPHSGRDRDAPWRPAIEVSGIRGIRQSRLQTIEARCTARGEYDRWCRAICVECAEHVVERAVLEHHHDDVLNGR